MGINPDLVSGRKVIYDAFIDDNSKKVLQRNIRGSYIGNKNETIDDKLNLVLKGIIPNEKQNDFANAKAFLKSKYDKAQKEDPQTQYPGKNLKKLFDKILNPSEENFFRSQEQKAEKLHKQTPEYKIGEEIKILEKEVADSEKARTEIFKKFLADNQGYTLETFQKWENELLSFDIVDHELRMKLVQIVRYFKEKDFENLSYEEFKNLTNPSIATFGKDDCGVLIGSSIDLNLKGLFDALKEDIEKNAKETSALKEKIAQKRTELGTLKNPLPSTNPVQALSLNSVQQKDAANMANPQVQNAANVQQPSNEQEPPPGMSPERRIFVKKRVINLLEEKKKVRESEDIKDNDKIQNLEKQINLHKEELARMESKVAQSSNPAPQPTQNLPKPSMPNDAINKPVNNGTSPNLQDWTAALNTVLKNSAQKPSAPKKQENVAKNEELDLTPEEIEIMIADLDESVVNPHAKKQEDINNVGKQEVLTPEEIEFIGKPKNETPVTDPQPKVAEEEKQDKIEKTDHAKKVEEAKVNAENKTVKSQEKKDEKKKGFLSKLASPFVAFAKLISKCFLVPINAIKALFSRKKTEKKVEQTQTEK